MTNAEVHVQTALRAYQQGLLTISEKQFIEKVKDYSKKRLTKLTADQFEWLRDIAKKYGSTPIPQLHVITVEFLAKINHARVVSFYLDQEISLPLNNEPGSITPALDTARKYLEERGFNIIGYCSSKVGIYHLVSDTFKKIVDE